MAMCAKIIKFVNETLRLDLPPEEVAALTRRLKSEFARENNYTIAESDVDSWQLCGFLAPKTKDPS